MTENKKGKGGKRKVPVEFLLACLEQMIIDGDWVYKYGEMKWKQVDCVGMIRLIYQQYSQYRARNKVCGATVDNFFKMSSKYCFTEPVSGNESDIREGYAIFWYNKSKGVKGKSPYYHIGVYIGEYINPITNEYIADAVIHCSIENGKVMAESLSFLQEEAKEKGGMMYFGPLKDVMY